jgi:hypothetical protein
MTFAQKALKWSTIMEPNECDMTYMYPNYISMNQIPELNITLQHNGKYSLHYYIEGMGRGASALSVV